MKAFMAFLVIVGAIAGIYFGYMFIVGKTFNTSPKVDTTDSTADWKSQSQQSADLMRKQRDLMRQRQDRLRDMQHR